MSFSVRSEHVIGSLNVVSELSNVHVALESRSTPDRLRVEVLANAVVRVRAGRSEEPKVTRTWTICDEHGHMPREGRDRQLAHLRTALGPNATPVAMATTSSSSSSSIRLEVGDTGVSVHVLANEGRLEFRIGDRVLLCDLPHRAYVIGDRGVAHYVRRKPGQQHFYGFGETSGPLDKHGRAMTMMPIDAMGYDAERSNPLYKHWPFYITYDAELGVAFGLFYDNFAPASLDMGQEIDAFFGFYSKYEAVDGDLDYYFIAGPTVADVVTRFVRLTGLPELMPRWSLGYLGSTMAYTEAPNAQERLGEFVTLCKEHDIECEMFHLSSGYTTDAQGRRNVFTWNRSRVPDPKTMCSNFTDNGIRLAANIKPFLLETHPLFASAAAAGVLVTDGSATKQPFRSTFWAGGAFSVGYGAFIDFSSEAGFDFWVEQLRTNVLAYGIQVPWNDNNEFRMHDDAVLAGFGAPLRASLARPLQTLLMAMASRDACLRARPGQRPYVLTRSACVGVQRHCQSWSGDNMTSFHTLLHNLPMGTGMALSGLGNTGHDVGGFYGPLPGRELWLRWIASQVFMPRFTIHSFNTDGTVTSPWCHEDAIGDVRHMLRFRRRLRPTLYSAMWRSSRDGTPPIRPLVFDFAADERCRTESSLYMLGDSILVVSAVREGATSVDVTLPATSRWCEWHSGEWFDGGAHLKLPAPLGRCLFFVRAGGAVALCDGANDAAVRVVLAVPPAPSDGSDAQSLWPDEQARATSLIFDDGESLAYRDGAFAQLDVSAVRDGNAVAVRVTVVHDGFARPQSVPVALLGADDEVHLAAGGLRQLEAGDDDNSAHVPKRLVWFDVPVHK